MDWISEQPKSTKRRESKVQKITTATALLLFPKKVLKNTINTTANNAHNTFVEYWLSGGLLGLLFILYYFLAPLIKMWKERKWNYLPVAIVISMFVAANTCAIANLEDSLPVVVFMLSLFYLYSALFKEVQDKRYELKSGNIS